MPTVLKEIKQGVAIITLNREDKVNSINREMAHLLHQLIQESVQDNSIKAIYLTGTGKSFCAGQDLAEVSDTAMLDKILPEQLNPLVSLIRNLKKPVVAAVKGIAAGAGASLALSCDIVVASASASFIQAFSKIGLIPDSGATHILPRLIGWQKAAAYMMLADKINGEEAERTGMIYKVFPDDVFEEESFKIALALTQVPPKALALTKEALNRSARHSFDEQLKVEEELQSIAGRSKDFADRIAAFMQRKKT
jgi:2-(1,2-epoxy-1,2-dihydrophenyl)acetyl-CoA isomerase